MSESGGGQIIGLLRAEISGPSLRGLKRRTSSGPSPGRSERHPALGSVLARGVLDVVRKGGDATEQVSLLKNPSVLRRCLSNVVVGLVILPGRSHAHEAVLQVP